MSSSPAVDTKTPLKMVAGYTKSPGFTTFGDVTIASSLSSSFWRRPGIDAQAHVVNPRTVIKYRFIAPSGNGVQQVKVATHIREWEKYAHVSFVRMSDADLNAEVQVLDDAVTDAEAAAEAEPNTPALEAAAQTARTAASSMLRISFDDAEGNSSLVGVGALDVDMPSMSTMNLGEVLDVVVDDPELKNMDRHIILHEFGHALGLFHEHQSPARQGLLTPNASCKDHRLCGGSVDRANMQILNEDSLEANSSFSTLDLDSVMMYDIEGKYNDEGIEFGGLKHELSNLDKAYMVINYPRIGARAEAPEWTMEYALDTVGLSAEIWPKEREEILEKYRERPYTQTQTTAIREKFGIWTRQRYAAEQMFRQKFAEWDARQATYRAARAAAAQGGDK